MSRWACTGFLTGGILAILALILVDTFMRKDSDEVKAWTEFAMMMGIFPCAIIGMVLGVICKGVHAFITDIREDGKKN
jgi:hypothetical protein